MNAQNDGKQFARDLILSGVPVRIASETTGVTRSAARNIYRNLVKDGVLKSAIGPKAKLDHAQMMQAYDMLMDGVPRNRIAASFGVSQSTINAAVNKLRDAGAKLPERALICPDVEFYRHGFKRGSIKDAFRGLSSRQIALVCREIPKGCSVADWLRSLVVDAVNDMEGGK